MELRENHSLNIPVDYRNKDRQLLADNIRKAVLRKVRLSLSELHQSYPEDRIFYLGLRYVTTTKKAICKALNINIDNACRYKRDLEKRGLLVQSAEQRICPYTKHAAHFLSTNPKEFAKLEKSNQTKPSKPCRQ